MTSNKSVFLLLTSVAMEETKKQHITGFFINAKTGNT